jgi:hypothetical protein
VRGVLAVVNADLLWLMDERGRVERGGGEVGEAGGGGGEGV